MGIQVGLWQKVPNESAEQQGTLRLESPFQTATSVRNPGNKSKKYMFGEKMIARPYLSFPGELSPQIPGLRTPLWLSQSVTGPQNCAVTFWRTDSSLSLADLNKNFHQITGARSSGGLCETASCGKR